MYIFYFMRFSLVRFKSDINRRKTATRAHKNPNFVQQSGYFLKEKLVRNDSAEFFDIFFQ